MIQTFRETFAPVLDLLNYNIFALGEARITPLSIFYLIILVIALFYVSRKLKDLLVGRILSRTRLEAGAQQAIGTIFRYFLLFTGFVIILQTVGIDLTTLNVLAGAVGIGIGLGLQNIANNFISGLIILIERPIQIGDRIEVDDVNGEVTAIGARASRIRTNDNITIIVPNSKFISEDVINWSFENRMIRFKIPVSVAYSSDVDLVTDLLLEVARENKDVAEKPAPSVRLLRFDDNGIYFELRAWSSAQLARPGLFKSDLNYAIFKKFRENNVEMPFPQRDLHIRSGAVAIGKNGNGDREWRAVDAES